jgi:hypothetical protein
MLSPLEDGAAEVRGRRSFGNRGVGAIHHESSPRHQTGQVNRWMRQAWEECEAGGSTAPGPPGCASFVGTRERNL